MKKLMPLIAALLSLTAFGQALDGYKYAYVQKLKYRDGGYDIYGLASKTMSFLQKKGFHVLGSDDKLWPKEATMNICEVMKVKVNNEGGAIVILEISNCKEEIIYQDESHSVNWANDFASNYNRSLNNLFNRFPNYSYDDSKTPQIDYPAVEKTNENEETIKDYLTNNLKLDPIEGIYKSFQSLDFSPYYKIGIIRAENKFKAIIIESEYKQWESGEVKAYFEQSSLKGIYSVKWYLGDKVPFETFGMLDNEALLSIEFKNIETNEKAQEKYIKMFPAAHGDIAFKKDNAKASGSGFFLTTGGILATNAHVIEDAKNIEVLVSNDVGTFSYKAKVLLVDIKNDVALVKIDDDTFKGLSSIPYGIIEKADIGEKVFTIGYPLNNVMGMNYKVNDGIISAKSGIADDVRYYQISVPLQPGNSGGPLFDKTGNIIGITSAKLNSKVVGTEIENVNYAIKSSYLVNLYKMLPETKTISATNNLSGKELQDQVKILKNYVCLIKIF